MCISKIFYFTVSFEYKDGHLTQFWMIGYKNVSTENFWATFDFPDIGSTPSFLLFPSFPCLE